MRGDNIQLIRSVFIQMNNLRFGLYHTFFKSFTVTDVTFRGFEN